MMKIAFATAVVAPVLVLAYGSDRGYGLGETVEAAPAAEPAAASSTVTATPRQAVLGAVLASGPAVDDLAMDGTARVVDAAFAPRATAPHAGITDTDTASCDSATVGVVFSRGYLESHSAAALGEVFGATGCAVEGIRITHLVPDDPEPADFHAVDAQRAELAAHIQALVGRGAARDLPVLSETHTAFHTGRQRRHALVRIERGDALRGHATDPLFTLAADTVADTETGADRSTDRGAAPAPVATGSSALP